MGAPPPARGAAPPPRARRPPLKKDRRPPPEPEAFRLREGEAHVELQSLLKFVGACESGGGAKQAIQAGEVRVNGDVERRRSRKLVAGDLVEHRRRSWRVESPGGA